jgi:hypothetical protein
MIHALCPLASKNCRFRGDFHFQFEDERFLFFGFRLPNVQTLRIRLRLLILKRRTPKTCRLLGYRVLLWMENSMIRILATVLLFLIRTHRTQTDSQYVSEKFFEFVRTHLAYK